MQHGYQLRGGRRPDLTAVANLLAHHEVHGPDGEPLGEPLLLLASGGIGAGYQLHEFTRDGSKPLLLGFRARWQEPATWLKSTLDRLAVPFEAHTTGSRRAAAKRLTAELDAGRPAIVLPDRYHLGYWHLPKSAEAAGGHLIVVHPSEQDAERVCVDEGNLAPLTVPRAALDLARDRVGEYRNLLLSLRTEPAELDRSVLATAVRAGLADCVKRLGGGSAWAKWARLLTDERGTGGWPSVFADRRGLVGALLDGWEAIEVGGHLRDLFAEGLTGVADLLELPGLEPHAARWQAIGRRWQELAEAALSQDEAEFAWMRGLTLAVADGVRAGDEGQEAAAEAGAELWRLREHHDARSPFTGDRAERLFAELGTLLREIQAAETAAVAELAELLG